MTNLLYRADVKQKITERKLISTPSRYIYECLLYVYQDTNKYQTHNQKHNYNSRKQIRTYFIPLEKSRMATNYHGPKFFNKIPETYTQLPEKTFKNRIKEFLTLKAFYSGTEFFNCTIYLNELKLFFSFS